MLPLLPALVLAAFDGAAALDHASKLAALGPHPWGSPRGSWAARYVEAQFRDAGLTEVRLQEFESHGIRGTNVLGVRRAPGSEFVVVAAHHDTAPDSPGAYDDGGGVGVLIELARVLAREPSRPRTLVFASFDGEEAWAQRTAGASGTPGSRSYIESLGVERRSLVAALVIEMCGWKEGTPVLQPIPYADPLRPQGSVVAPAWLLEAALAGSREAGAPLGVGDPLVPWLYQATVRMFRIPHHYGDDQSFLQAGLPAVMATDSSFSAYYPWYHQSSDTADKLDAGALARMGQGVLGAVRALEQVRPGRAQQTYFAAFGTVLGAGSLLAAGALSLLPGLVRAFASGGVVLVTRFVQAALFVLLLWSHPIPALFVLALPNLLTAAGRRWATLLSLVPALALAGLGAAAAWRGFVGGVWLPAWELAVLAFALALVLVPLSPPKPAKGARSRKGR